MGVVWISNLVLSFVGESGSGGNPAVENSSSPRFSAIRRCIISSAFSPSSHGEKSLPMGSAIAQIRKAPGIFATRMETMSSSASAIGQSSSPPP
jgi:hypothetical protein